jgi:hypothetical protein
MWNTVAEVLKVAGYSIEELSKEFGVTNPKKCRTETSNEVERKSNGNTKIKKEMTKTKSKSKFKSKSKSRRKSKSSSNSALKIDGHNDAGLLVV